MEHIATRRSILTVPFMLLIALAAMGAVVSRSPATAATGSHCTAPKPATSDRVIAQIGKVHHGVATPLMAVPIDTASKHSRYTRDSVFVAPVSYVRCAKNQG